MGIPPFRTTWRVLTQASRGIIFLRRCHLKCSRLPSCKPNQSKTERLNHYELKKNQFH